MSPSSTIAHDISRRLHETGRHFHKTEVKANAFLFLSVLIASMSFLAFVELLLHFNSAVRTIVVVVAGAALVGFAVWYILLPLLRLAGILFAGDDTLIARRVGDYFPGIRDRLTNFLQLQQEAATGTSLYSMELLDASFKDLADLVKTIDFNRSVDESAVAKRRRWFTASASAAVLLFVVFPASIPGAYFRLAHFNTEFVPPPKYLFNVSPGNKEVVKGEEVKIRVQLSSPDRFEFLPASIDLLYRIQGQDRFDQQSMKQDSVGVYRSTFQNVRATTEYYVRASDVQSQRYTLNVLDRPILRSLRVRLDFPAYCRLPARVQDDFSGDVTALAGTRVSIKGSASKEITGAEIIFGRDSVTRLTIAGDKFSGGFELHDDGSYHIGIADRDGLTNVDPVQYNLKVIPDVWPTVAIVQPGRNLDIAGDQSMQILIHAEDDFGFTQLRLGYRLIHSRFAGAQQDYTYLRVAFPQSGQTELEAPYQWDLSKLSLVPEDVVEYFAEIYDNDTVKGPKSAKSNLYLLRLPSLQEVFTDVNKGHEQSIAEMKQALEDAKSLKEDIESINADIKQNKDIDWQQQKKMEAMTKKYQDIQASLQNVQKQLDDMVQKMDQQKVLSKETMEKYLELQQLFQELNSSELQQALKQMQQSMQNVSKEQLQQAMKQMTFSEEQFRQGIERTMELLKRIQIEQKVDEVKKRAQELEQLQKELTEEGTKQSNDQEKQNELAARQEDLTRKEQGLENASSELAKRMEEFFTEMPLDKLNEMNKQLQQENLGDQMKSTAQQMRQGQNSQVRQSQQKIQESLQKFSEQMDALQQQMLQQQAQHVLNQLRKATDDLLELSKREEALKQQSQRAAPNSPQLRQNAEDQLQAAQDLGNVVTGLNELSKRSFAVTPEMGKAIGEAMARMQNAMKDLDIRNGSTASQEQEMAMSSLNKGAVQVQNALQAMMQGSEGGMGGLLQQLQMLAGRQMGLNLKSEQLGSGMSMEQAAEAGRLGQEQEAIRKSLDQLNKEAQASQEQQKLLGDLGKISEEMKEVVTNLQQNNVSPETIRKQERILSRLLDASKSMNERDYEKKRKSQTGTRIVGKNPDELRQQDLNASDKLREDLLKALEQGYSRDYQELIRKYFEALQKAENVDHP
ncbi:MAG TPA: DUF4175 family protein [Bacteroidota bacterium]